MNKHSVEEIKQKFAYDPESGALFNVASGKPAGTIKERGYTEVQVDRKHYPGTHIAWVIVHGRWPTHTIDHKDRNPTNNRLNNLREATFREQNYNRSVYKNSRTGVTGVTIKDGKYRARITIEGKETHLGAFPTLEEAKLARMKAELEHYGQFSPLVNT